MDVLCRPYVGTSIVIVIEMIVVFRHVHGAVTVDGFYIGYMAIAKPSDRSDCRRVIHAVAKGWGVSAPI
jgi:hypothetical protein